MFTHSPTANDNITKVNGFTLIELSIVLVIIGLVIGGVMVGQSLIRSSGIRSTISQLEKYNSAIGAFQLKYDFLPGDIPGSKAANFGFYNVTGVLTDTIACGDGNGIIQGWNANVWVEGGNFAGEVIMFFLHLSQARLIDGMYGAGGSHVTVQGATPTGGSYNGVIPPSVTVESTYVNEILPAAKLGRGNFFTVGSTGGINYFILTAINRMDTHQDMFSTNNLSPNDSYTIDLKIDDGLPATGTVFALDTVTNFMGNDGMELITPSANNCVNSGAYYTKSSTYANALNCSLRFDFQ